MNNPDKASIVYCFLDTNILIHFKMFDEVDWCEVLEAEQAYLMLAPAVIAELNQHKDNRNNEWRQKRARKVLAKLKDILKETTPGNPAHVRDRVLLLEITREPRVDWGALGLDPQVKDDRLLATVIEYTEQQPSNRILLISDDFLVQRRGPTYNIQVIEPRETIKEIEQPPATASRIQELERQLQEYKSQLPDLSFSFWEKVVVTNLVTRVITRKPDSGLSDFRLAHLWLEQIAVVSSILMKRRFQRNQNQSGSGEEICFYLPLFLHEQRHLLSLQGLRVHYTTLSIGARFHITIQSLGRKIGGP